MKEKDSSNKEVINFYEYYNDTPTSSKRYFHF